jgi:glutamine amidotransferase
VKSVVVLDYGMGNLDSVRRALEECGARPYVSSEPASLGAADAVVLPGVGAFALAMQRLRELRLDTALREEVLGQGVPLLGICLGMQILAKASEEGEATPGLGFIDADVQRLSPRTSNERVPHMGWNDVRQEPGSRLFRDIPPGSDFYFVHSYHMVCRDDSDVLATTDYCGGFTSVVARDSIVGVQFHPEKSQRFGLALLRNFLAL